MNNIFLRILNYFLAILLFIALFSSAIQLIVYNLDYYEWHYEHREIMKDTGMNLDNLMEVTERLVSYLEDDAFTLNMTAMIDGKEEEVFGQREKDHMVDVKDMALILENVKRVGYLAVFFSMGVLYLKNKPSFLEFLSKIKYVFALLSTLIIAIAALLIYDFNKYFTLFHEMFFSNDLWILDPKTDILINMVPEIFFFTTAVLVIIVFVILMAITIFLAEITRKNLKKKFG